jgi:flagellar L-ring protein precursor FlgH
MSFARFRFSLVFSGAAVLCACATADYSSQATPPVVRPKPLAVTPASPGSLFPVSLGQGTPRPLFEDRRARAVGDLLQVIVRESTDARRASGNQASRAASADLSMSAAQVPFARALNGPTMAAESDLGFQGKGSASANNNFTGTLMVMVTQVLSNGNLVVSGEKQIAIGKEEEFIRFSGIINPADLNNNSVLSTQVADARLEYRGRGAIDDSTQPGWLSRSLLKVWPF